MDTLSESVTETVRDSQELLTRLRQCVPDLRRVIAESKDRIATSRTLLRNAPHTTHRAAEDCAARG